MSIEFKWLDESSDLGTISMNESEFFMIEIILSKLEEKTGIFVDPYSTTRLSPDHAKILLNLMNEYKLSGNSKLTGLANILKISKDKSQWILVVGD